MLNSGSIRELGSRRLERLQYRSHERCPSESPGAAQRRQLVSSAETGYFYVTKKNVRNSTGKLELKKYDPVARKHVVFREAKIK